MILATNNGNLHERFMDSVLEEALTQYDQQECASLMEECAQAPDPEYSPRFKQGMNKLFRQERRERHKRLRLVLGRVAVVALVLMVGTSAMALSVEAVRGSLWEFLLGLRADYTSFIKDEKTIEYTQDMIPEGWDCMYVPKYLPKGYELTKILEEDQSVIFTFEKQQDRETTVTFSQTRITRKGRFVDTEDALGNKVDVHGNTGFVTEKDGMINLQWDNSTFTFQLYSSLSEDQIFKIAKNVKKLEKDDE